MSSRQSRFSEYLEELKRRKVVRVAVTYVIGAWLLLQVADATFEPINLPRWSISLLLWPLVLGFPVAVMFTWALDVTPRGMRRAR